MSSYDDIIICKSDALKDDCPLNIIHRTTYMDPDPTCNLLELESQNVVFIVVFPQLGEIRGIQALASTSALSPFPDLGTRTWDGTLLTYGSGRVVCTGHKTVHDAIININALSRTFATELNRPISILKGELTNLVVAGRLNFRIDREKLRTIPEAHYSVKFDGTSFNAIRVNGKDMRVSVFPSGRFNIPGLQCVEEAKLALLQTYKFMSNCKATTSIRAIPQGRNGRNTTRKRRRVRDW